VNMIQRGYVAGGGSTIHDRSTAGNFCLAL
jgi:hypothetical protein